MANLAIKGHATRGGEVIKILEMLGGKTRRGRFTGNEISCGYYIKADGYIGFKYYSLFHDTTVFTLEDFLEKFPYKVGDKVCFSDDPHHYLTIMEIWWNDDCSDLECTFYEDNIDVSVSDLQPYKEETMEKGIIYDEIDFNRCPHADKVELILGDNYEIQVAEGKTYVVKKKPQYPKTFIEVLNFWHPDRQLEDDYQRCYKKDLIEKFQDLLYARDAYWKIAGDELGLGKLWKPDYGNGSKYKYTISFSANRITKSITNLENRILAFPTEEMRDAFYENFKDLIEGCKELL